MSSHVGEGDPVTGARTCTRQGRDGTTVLFYRLLDQPLSTDRLKVLHAQWQALSMTEREALPANYARAIEADGLFDPAIVAAWEQQGATAEGFVRAREQQQRKYAGLMQARDYGSLLQPATLGKTLQPLPGAHAAEVAATFREIEGVADVRFFPLDALSEADRAYLNAQMVTIPAQPDQLLGYLPELFNERDTVAFAGRGEHFTDRTLPVVFGQLSNTALAEVVRHELLHAMGLGHVHKEAVPRGVNSDTQTLMGDTLCRYAQYQPLRIQEWDVAALQKIYGVSKQPSDLPAHLAKEEAAFKALTVEVQPMLEADLTSMLRDDVFTQEELQQLRSKAAVLLEHMVDAEGLALLGERNQQALLRLVVKGQEMRVAAPERAASSPAAAPGLEYYADRLLQDPLPRPAMATPETQFRGHLSGLFGSQYVTLDTDRGELKPTHKPDTYTLSLAPLPTPPAPSGKPGPQR